MYKTLQKCKDSFTLISESPISSSPFSLADCQIPNIGFIKLKITLEKLTKADNPANMIANVAQEQAFEPAKRPSDSYGVP